MKIRFLSRNEFKIAEVRRILEVAHIQIVPFTQAIHEIQTQSINDIARDKCLKAFTLVGTPVLVEHTGLFLHQLNGLPGGLTQLFWDALEADRFTALFGNGGDNRVEAKTVLAYCDTRTIRLFEGSITGTIPSEPRGPRDFQWDCVFVPDGYETTFAEMGEDKNTISMRKRALDAFASFVEGKS
jgi:XTP/dITP diphosphohydrolase